MYPTQLTYHSIMQNPQEFVFDKTVKGYECDSRYNGGSIYTLLKAWNYETGTRRSFYNEDRIQIQTLFDVFDKIEEVLNSHKNVFKTSFIQYLNSLSPANPVIGERTKINILGWVCQNSPTRSCNLFPAEWAISSKYFTPNLRYSCFAKRSPECHPKFYKFVGNSEPIEITEEHALSNFEFPSYQSGGRKTTLPSKKDTSIDASVNNEEYATFEYANVPEDKNSDLFKLFFDTSEEEENKYIQQPETFANAIKDYIAKSQSKTYRTKKSRSKKSRSKKSRTKKSRSKKSRSKKSRTKKSRTKKSRTKKSRTKKSRTKTYLQNISNQEMSVL